MRRYRAASGSDFARAAWEESAGGGRPDRPAAAAAARARLGPATAKGSVGVTGTGRLTGEGVALEAAEEKNASGPSSAVAAAAPVANGSDATPEIIAALATGARKVGCFGSDAIFPVNPSDCADRLAASRPLAMSVDRPDFGKATGGTGVKAVRGRNILSSSAAKSGLSAMDKRATSVGAIGAGLGPATRSVTCTSTADFRVHSRLLCSRTVFHRGQNLAVR